MEKVVTFFVTTAVTWMMNVTQLIAFARRKRLIINKFSSSNPFVDYISGTQGISKDELRTHQKPLHIVKPTEVRKSRYCKRSTRIEISNIKPSPHLATTMCVVERTTYKFCGHTEDVLVKSCQHGNADGEACRFTDPEYKTNHHYKCGKCKEKDEKRRVKELDDEPEVKEAKKRERRRALADEAVQFGRDMVGRQGNHR